ncbi:TonB-dependent Receptor Plug Domain [Granulicella rosea]|uniref:TonB-dependent Receptor Plug Domain n=1 Tax=Granulicella rosea TaxID=474952 RepID=A0A239MFL0_9BACT|nr:carboxypeptidase regulatory-like domain-containing protein [Granulicella rosea]SNT41466.1 TonB-dependent Receptor Plug Domain [Granulicella rosea]
MQLNQSSPFQVIRVSSFARTWVFLLLLCAMLTGNALAQSDTGRISGTVTDASGAVVVGAQITATRTETAVTTTTTTDKRGEYVFATLQVGHYTITVESPGFASATKEGLELNDNGALNAIFKLQAGATEQMIVTTQVGETVNTSTGEISHVIDGDTVRDLALNGRNYLDLLGILPGSVVMNGGDAMATITSGSTTGIVLNGIRATANGLYIDGVINKDIGSNATQFNNVGIDFVEHVKVETSAFSSQFGSAAGPAINVVTRSGTNSLHGTLFELIRNDLLDASNYFSRSAQQNPNGTYNPIRQHLRFNDFGGALGGPIMKDKLYFFMGAEWKIIAQNTNPSIVTLPLQAQLNGVFPLTTAGACSLSKVPGLGNVPSTCDISNYITPFGHGVQKVFNEVISKATSYAGVACTLTGCSNNGNTIYELPQPFRNHEYLARVDWIINKRHNVYARWIDDTHTTTNPLGDGSLPTTSYHDEGPADNFLFVHNMVVTPNSTNTLSLSALWSSINQQPVGPDWLKSTYGLDYQSLYQGQTPKLGIPYLSLYGYTAFDSDNFLNRSHSTYAQVQDVYTMVEGKHTIKVGGLFGRNRKDQNGKPYFYGNVAFTNASTSLNTSGNALADMLLGNFATYTESASDTYGFFRLWQAAGYVDDTWRIAPKLSLSLGLRFEWMTPWDSQQNNLASFYPEFYDPKAAVTVNSNGTLVAGSGNRYNGLRRAGDGVPNSELFRVPNGQSADVLSVPTIGKRGFYKAQRVIAPRFGFAYDMFGNGTLAFRGGAGLFYDTPQGNVAFSALNSPPYLQSAAVQNGNMDNLAAFSSQLNLSPNGDMYAVSSTQQRAYVYQYNFGIQQQLMAGMFLQITYVGNEARHMLHDPDVNGVDPGVEDAAFQVNQNVNINALRPYKGFGAIYQYRTDADGNYNGLQANLNRRIGKGRFTFAYTWSKSLSTSSADTDVAHIFPFSKTYYYGYTSFDRRNLITTSYIVSSPTFARHNIVMREGLGGWMITGTGRYQGGTRLTPQGTDTLGVAGKAEYAGYPILYPHTQVAWWEPLNPGNIANVYAPAPGQIGNVPNGLIAGPNYVDLDVSMRKTFNFTERYRLTVNFDGFNVLNHPNFNSPTVNVNSATTVSDTQNVSATNTAGHDYSYLGITSANRPRNIQGGLRFAF